MCIRDRSIATQQIVLRFDNDERATAALNDSPAAREFAAGPTATSDTEESREIHDRPADEIDLREAMTSSADSSLDSSAADPQGSEPGEAHADV